MLAKLKSSLFTCLTFLFLSLFINTECNAQSSSILRNHFNTDDINFILSQFPNWNSAMGFPNFTNVSLSSCGTNSLTSTSSHKSASLSSLEAYTKDIMALHNGSLDDYPGRDWFESYAIPYEISAPADTKLKALTFTTLYKLTPGDNLLGCIDGLADIRIADTAASLAISGNFTEYQAPYMAQLVAIDPLTGDALILFSLRFQFPQPITLTNARYAFEVTPHVDLSAGTVMYALLFPRSGHTTYTANHYNETLTPHSNIYSPFLLTGEYELANQSGHEYHSDATGSAGLF